MCYWKSSYLHRISTGLDFEKAGSKTPGPDEDMVDAIICERWVRITLLNSLINKDTYIQLID